MAVTTNKQLLVSIIQKFYLDTKSSGLLELNLKRDKSERMISAYVTVVKMQLNILSAWAAEPHYFRDVNPFFTG